MLITPSNGVHTLGMRFAIDVVFLDRQKRVVGIREKLKPYRMTSLNWSSQCVLELPEGTIRQTETRVGDQLVFE